MNKQRSKCQAEDKGCKEIQLNNLINQLMETSKSNNSINTCLDDFFNLLIWVEKRKQDLIANIIGIGILPFIADNFRQERMLLIKLFILLLGNCRENGILVRHVLKARIVDSIIQKFIYGINQDDYDQEESLSYFGSLLKVYHRHFSLQTYELYQNGNRHSLLQICCKFYNCPQELTKTSVMNILMTMLKLPFSKQFIYRMQDNNKLLTCLSVWSLNACRQLRNELKDFDQRLLVQNEQPEIQYTLQQINDKIIFWEDLSEANWKILSNNFWNQVILPLIIGSLNTKGIPLFTLKFSLFSLGKLVRVISNLNLINKLGQLLFKQCQIVYFDEQLDTTILKCFNISTILQQVVLVQINHFNHIPQIFKNVNNLLMNIMRSKDDQFLQLHCNLLTQVLCFVKKNQQCVSFYIEKLGFGLNGEIVDSISQILIHQFSATHRLNTLQTICQLLLYIQPSRYLQNDCKSKLIYSYKEITRETEIVLQKNQYSWPYIAQIMEYDIKIVNNMIFKPVIKQDMFLLNISQDNQSTPFYDAIPDTPQGCTRHQVVQYFIVTKLISIIFEEQMSMNQMISNYQARSNQQYESKLKPGTILSKHQKIQCKTRACKIIQNKVQIPCLLFQDNNRLILGFSEQKQIKILINIKIKHCVASIEQKKNKIYIKVKSQKFDYQTENMKEKADIFIREFQNGIHYFTEKQAIIKGRQLRFLGVLLKKSISELPEISLL